MFFIMGVNQRSAEISYRSPLIICDQCGRYGRYQVFVTYMCLSLFFIPVLKWGRKYYVKTGCCGTVFELDPQIGKRLARGEQIDITPDMLTLVSRGGGQAAWQSTQRADSQAAWQSTQRADGQAAQLTAEKDGGQAAQLTAEQDGGRGAGRPAKRCDGCGYETTEDFEYCPKCGRKFREKDASAPQ